jgi:hypothetical protein
MMGLFGSSIDDPKTLGILQLASGLMSSPRFGQGMSQGLLAYGDTMQRAKQQQAQEKLNALREEQMRMQMEQQRAQMQQQQTDQQAMRGMFTPMSGPTQDQGPLMPRFDPRTLLGQGASPEAALQALNLHSAMNPKPPKRQFEKVEGHLLEIPEQGDPRTVFSAPEKAKPIDYNDLVIPGPDGKPMLNQLALQAKRQIARDGASRVNVPVNLGQKGLDNTLKIRSDWRSEPVYKAHQDVQSAHAQIKSALAANSPIGDTAAATKIMKILDPGSVVRESELGMALAATGLLDRVANYADLIIKGQRLNPTQRKEFGALADALAAESGKAYNAKRSEYQGIADRNGLNREDVLGPESATKAANTQKVLRFDAQGNPIKD